MKLALLPTRVVRAVIGNLWSETKHISSSLIHEECSLPKRTFECSGLSCIATISLFPK